MVIVGFKCAPETAPKEKMNSVMRNQFVIPPSNGPMNAALSKGPSCAVGGEGI